MFAIPKIGLKFGLTKSIDYRMFCTTVTTVDVVISRLPLKKLPSKQYKLLSPEEKHEIAKERIKFRRQIRKEKRNASFALLTTEEKKQIHSITHTNER